MVLQPLPGFWRAVRVTFPRVLAPPSPPPPPYRSLRIKVVLPLPDAPSTNSTESGLPTSPKDLASALLSAKISVHAFVWPGANGVVAFAAFGGEDVVARDSGRDDINGRTQRPVPARRRV